MYCPTKWHDSVSKHKTLEDFKVFWQEIYSKSKDRNLNYKISFSGGEATSNKNFLPFVAWLRENYNNKIDSILLTTNGSASYQYYLKSFKLIDNISFSVHSEHIQEQKFFNTILNLKKTIDSDKFIHVNIMDEFWNQERIKYYCTLLETNNISYNVNKIDYSHNTRETPIFKGRLDFEI
jgi:molybdenum cofactor biosynthesis enzyme MoaA